MADKVIKINKVDNTPRPDISIPKKLNTLKTFPKGILKTKIRATRDPAKNPPLKRTMRRHTIRIMTDGKVKNMKKTIKNKVSKMKDPDVIVLAKKNGLSDKTPLPLLREIIEGGLMAGFISQ